MGEKTKMLAGKLYTANDPELAADAARAAAWMARYNGMIDAAPEDRSRLLHEGMGSVGRGVTVRPPFHCDYGYNIHLGESAFLNFGCIVLDVARVDIGAGTQIGPGVQILTADHPREPALRARALEFGRPIRIGANVWIGGGALILPGVTIGDDAIVGAGSVVTRDVGAGETVVGNPARLARQ
ncbi:maltose O-acetyltransferase [Sphingomonas gellani]|uniref:Nodulation protein L n=1 Tax=Sphingomonas gellani TaxID=1166340 RepID=A0A1H8JYS6_9SPHN|nr:sugar O-acetyltransferase [Sphingomonas gellani]SEN85843.1 maltose O-acetyltransferase [Sphingomonas gellani]